MISSIRDLNNNLKLSSNGYHTFYEIHDNILFEGYYDPMQKMIHCKHENMVDYKTMKVDNNNLALLAFIYFVLFYKFGIN